MSSTFGSDSAPCLRNYLDKLVCPVCYIEVEPQSCPTIHMAMHPEWNNPDTQAVIIENNRVLYPDGLHIPPSMHSPRENEIASFNFKADFGIPTFCPTLEEMKNREPDVFMMEEVEAKGLHLQTGLVKITTPEDFNPRKDKYKSVMDGKIANPKQQTLELVDEGAYRLRQNDTLPITIKKHVQLCERWNFRVQTSLNEEPEFWNTDRMLYRNGIHGTEFAESGSLFDDDWNIWNLSKLKTCLNLMDDDNETIPGISKSYIYYGAWPNLFPYHKENGDTYSANYLHYGKPKVWYTTHPEDHEKLLELMKKLYPLDFAKCAVFYRHKQILIHPFLLREHNIRYGVTLQKQGEYMLATAGGIHFGFSLGFNIGEAINFGTPNWLYGPAVVDYCDNQCTYPNHDFRVDLDQLRKLWNQKENYKKNPWEEERKPR